MILLKHPQGFPMTFWITYKLFTKWFHTLSDIASTRIFNLIFYPSNNLNYLGILKKQAKLS